MRKEGKTPKKAWIDVHTTKRRALYTNQLTPVHDYINFKKMTGNEILLNLMNVEHLTISEILGALNVIVQIPEEERLDKNIKWM
jgi:threonine dehydratase